MSLENGQAERDEALERVTRGARLWVRRAAEVAVDVGRHGPFTTDDVWQALGSDRPREPRAMGSVMNTLCRRGIIEKTGTQLPSRNRGAHARPKTEWQLTLTGEHVFGERSRVSNTVSTETRDPEEDDDAQYGLPL